LEQEGATLVAVHALPKRALEALVAVSASARVGPSWRCTVCGCIAVEAGKRMARRCRVLLASADTSGKVRLSGVPVPTGA
jgi:hypothetical protein